MSDETEYRPSKKQLALQSRAYVSAPAADAEADLLLRYFKSVSYREAGGLRLYQMPDETQRKVLLARGTMLHGSLKHDKQAVALLVTEMLQGYANAVKPHEGTSAEIIAKYVTELGLKPAVPTWAVFRACGAIRNGSTAPAEYGIGVVHRPSTMALRRFCESFVWETRAEIGLIGDILRGQPTTVPITEEERAAIGAKFQALADELRTRDHARDTLADAQAERERALIEQIGQDAWNSLPVANRIQRRKALAKAADQILSLDPRA